MHLSRLKALVLFGVPVAIALAVPAAYYWIQYAESRRWEQMRRLLEEMAREARARDARRPVLRGQAQEGNAWDDYAVIFSINPIRDLYPAFAFLEDDPKVDRANMESLARLHASTLEAIRRGAARETADRRMEWEEGRSSHSSRASYIAALCAVQARFLSERGQVRDSAELLLDTCQFALDSSRNAPFEEFLGGGSGFYIASRELGRLIASGRLSREDLLEIDRELSLLESGLHGMELFMVNDSMAKGFFLLKYGRVQPLLDLMEIRDVKMPTWRFGFSERLMIVDYFQSTLARNRLSAQSQGKPWKESQELQTEIWRQACDDRNPLTHLLMGGKRSRPTRINHDFLRPTLARLRLVRMAAQYAATGKVPFLEDPFGDKLLSAQTGAEMRFWSIGGDGTDDGGIGEWNPRVGQDIVLKLQLRKD